MAVFSLRRVYSCVALSLLAALAMLIPTNANAGTDVFGGGTGGIGSHATSLYASPYNLSGWGITTMKPLTPPAPDPAPSVIPSRGNFGAQPDSGYLGANGYGGGLSGGVGSSNLGGALQPLGASRIH